MWWELSSFLSLNLTDYVFVLEEKGKENFQIPPELPLFAQDGGEPWEKAQLHMAQSKINPARHYLKW